MNDLTRYLFMVTRMVWDRPEMAHAASALAPHFFVRGVHTGYPALIRPKWLWDRGVASRTNFFEPGARRPAGHTGRYLTDLEDFGVIRRKQFPDGFQELRRLYTLRPDDEWRWVPMAREYALADWAVMESPFDGAWDIAQEFAPLLSDRINGVSPHDPEYTTWVTVGKRYANRYGLDTLREAIRGALQDPDAVFPFTPHSFERHFLGLVFRGRRAA